MLDASRIIDYIAALARWNTAGASRVRWTWKALAAVVVLSVSTAAWAAAEFKVNGVVLPGGSVRVAENRYRLPDGFDTTAKWYARVYKPAQYPRRNIVNQPGIKAIHIVNTNTDESWSGINLYETQGQVRIFILARESR